ncbi:ABC transporter ATP-binding protein/permease [bacterium]|nr:ABC transporter ATP-binding protein/permease [bacterium]
MPLFIRFLRFAKNYRGNLGVALLLVFIGTALTLPMPKLTGNLIDASGLMENARGSGANVELARANAMHIAVYTCVLMLALSAAGAIVTYARGMILLFVGNRIVYDVRRRVFRHLQRLSLRYFETNPHGRIMARVLYDVEAVQSILSGGIVEIVSNVVTVIVIIVVLFSSNWMLAFCAIAVLPLYVLNFLVFRNKIRQAAAESREQYSEVYSTLSESISGIKIIMSFARESAEARRFVNECRQSIRLNLRTGRWQTLLGIGAGQLTTVANVAILLIGMREVLVTGRMSMGELIAFRTYLMMLYTPIIALVTVNDTINTVMTAVERIFETLDTVPDLQERRDAVRLGRVEGRVEFDKVAFSYEPGEMVLDDINFVAEPGSSTALVGPSGSGKTTLVHLIPRFYDPVGGRILLDGTDLRDVAIASLRGNIGMVMQENFLFMGTLRENIKYGRPEASDEEVVQASIAANCHDFIMEFPDGYETLVGERGTRLSGGQRQRISIARALLRNPRILILDEATSALDSESEALIQEALDRLMKGRTTFTIAHRLSTVMEADTILVLDQGKIVERGTHAELATMEGGLYARLCEVQFKKAEEKVAEHLAKTEEDKGKEKAAKRG